MGSRGQKPYLDWDAIGRSRKWLDYGLLCMYESSAMILVGADSFSYVALTSTLSWSGFEIVSPISGGTITVNSGSVTADDGDIIYIRNVEHPFKDETKTLAAGAPLEKATRKPTNLFLGVIRGGSIYLFPAGGGSGATQRFLEHDFVPVEWGQDGSVPPAAATDVISGNGTIKIREFSGSVNNQLIVPWEVPEDIVVDDGILFQVMGVFSAAAMTSQAMVFNLRGYSIGDSDPIGGSFGSSVLVNPSGTYAQYDRLATAFSTKVTVTNLAQGELAMLQLERQASHFADTYGSAFGVYGLKIRWTRKTEL